MKILYVEDNMANLFLVKRVAKMGNHEVINYIDGEDALTNLDRDQPDMILMDIQLAGAMSGLDVVKKLRARGHKVPVVAVTAYAMLGDRDRCLESGCDDYIAKPLPIAQLTQLFARYAARVKASQPAESTPAGESETAAPAVSTEASAPSAATPPAAKPDSAPPTEDVTEPAKPPVPTQAPSPEAAPKTDISAAGPTAEPGSTGSNGQSSNKVSDTIAPVASTSGTHSMGQDLGKREESVTKDDDNGKANSKLAL
jgi:CheY-like chemotaxis protein